MIVIGITGIIGSGKTTIARMLKNEGFNVIDLDGLVREVIKQKEAQGEIQKAFGERHIEDGQVDMGRLGETAFKSNEALRALEKIIHPRVRGELGKQVERLKRAGARVVLVDAPLLFETGLDRKLDKIVVVSAEMEKIRERLKRRGMAGEDVDRRMPFQIPLKEKEKKADHIVSNNGTEEDLKKELAALLEKIKEWEVRANAP
jgi:dephospho-CoA kinase